MSGDFDVFIKLLLSIALGFIIGLERNTTIERGTENFRLGGVRTFVLISLLGALSGITFASKYEILTYLTFTFMIVLVLISYVLYFIGIKSLGVTTEVATIISFLIGFAVTSEFISIKITLALVIIIAYILSQKEGIHSIMEKINRQEVGDLIKFAVIVLVILPFLPNVDYTLGDLLARVHLFDGIDFTKYLDIRLLNPAKLWFTVVLITGISVASHYFTKIFGKKNAFFLSSFFPGLVSSTSIVIAFSTQSKKLKDNKVESKKLAAGALVAHGASFVSILLLTLSLNYQLFTEVFVPFLIVGIISVGMGI